MRIPVSELAEGERVRSRDGTTSYTVASIEVRKDRLLVTDTRHRRHRYAPSTWVLVDREATGQDALLTRKGAPRARLASRGGRS